jgi:hypothetical protein
MSFSFSAPLISKAEEKAEYEAFTEAERKAISDDIYGHEDSFLRVDETLAAKGVAMFQQALEGIPDEEKLEYLEAKERAPEVLERECKPIAFLRAEDFDPWAAASRLVSYWKVRKHVFGSERAFFPMTLDGALREDIRTYELGHMLLCPPDKYGRPVYFWNRVRCSKAVASGDVFVSSYLSNSEGNWWRLSHSSLAHCYAVGSNGVLQHATHVRSSTFSGKGWRWHPQPQVSFSSILQFYANEPYGIDNFNFTFLQTEALISSIILTEA